MSGGAVYHVQVRARTYLDSVALMRHSARLVAIDGVQDAALMMATPANIAIMQNADLLPAEAPEAGGEDLLLAVRADDDAAVAAVNELAETLLTQGAAATSAGAMDATTVMPPSLRSAAEHLPSATLAVISVPGDFAASEARKALQLGLDVMIFSDNVPLAQELELKQQADRLGRLVMGPDCGTAMIGGVPLCFANQVAAGPVGMVAASGTGAQEVACLLSNHGVGLSHILGVGGRDLSDGVGGLSALRALDWLDNDAATESLVLISKPPSAAVATRLLDRIGRSPKAATVCFLGVDKDALSVPDNVVLTASLAAAASSVRQQVLGHGIEIPAPKLPAVSRAPAASGERFVRGLFCGGTLCAEAQLILRQAYSEAGESDRAIAAKMVSNAPVPGVAAIGELAVADVAANALIDLGADEYTRGRPHPMIEPSIRDEPLRQALADSRCAVVLVDLVLGYGAHADPAAVLADVVRAAGEDAAPVVASVTGTDQDPQRRDQAMATLQAAGITVAASNAAAATCVAQFMVG